VRGKGELLDGRPSGYRSWRVASSFLRIAGKGVRGSMKRRMVVLPCLKRRV